MAPEDQRLPAYWSGGEPITLENLHASTPLLQTSVPRLRARCFARQKGATDAEPLREIGTRLETVVLLPNVARGVAVFRGVLDVADDDAGDVELLLCALEKPDAPRSAEHYQAVMVRRLDKAKGHLQAMRDKDLLPDRDPAAPPFTEEPLSDMDGLLAREGVLEKRGRARARAELERARLSMRVLGLDPDEKLPRDLPPAEERPTLEDLPDYMERVMAQAAELQGEARVRQKSAEEEARRFCEENKLDFTALMERSKREGGGPPTFRADAEMARLRELAEVGRKAGVPLEEIEAKIEDPAMLAQLRKLEQTLMLAYRSFAHVLTEAPGLDAEARARGVREVERAVLAGESLAGRDLTGLDLSQVKLAGIDLHEALLEGADLQGVDLSGADLSGAVLARANLGRARLDGANLAGANLGEVDATDASFEGADLRGAVLYKARLQGARLAGADLRKASLLEAAIAAADLRGVDATEVLFFQMDLTDVSFAEARLGKASFVQCTALEGLDFSGAALQGTTFVDLRAERPSFRGARADNLRVVSASAIPGADFTGASIVRANLRGVDLTGATFEDAMADGADFSEANLHGARLVSMSGKGARFIRSDLGDADLTGSNLMGSMLQKAKLGGTRIEEANLFRAVLLQAKGDERTSFAGSHVKRVVFTRQDG